jgi:hypothetical protein
MNQITIQILILLFIFITTVWLQSSNNKDTTKNKESFYNKYKLPIFICAVVYLIMNYILTDCNVSFKNNDAYIEQIYVEPLYV